MGPSTAASGTLSAATARNTGASTPTAGSPRTTPAPRAAGARYFPASRLRDHRLPYPVRPRVRIPQRRQCPVPQRALALLLRWHQVVAKTRAFAPRPVECPIDATRLVEIKSLSLRRPPVLSDAVETHHMVATGIISALVFQMSRVNQICKSFPKVSMHHLVVVSLRQILPERLKLARQTMPDFARQRKCLISAQKELGVNSITFTSGLQ